MAKQLSGERDAAKWVRADQAIATGANIITAAKNDAAKQWRGETRRGEVGAAHLTIGLCDQNITNSHNPIWVAKKGHC